MVADRVWRRDFGADPSVLGRVVRLNNYSFTIVGVAAKGLTGVDVGVPTDIWLPLMMQKGRTGFADADPDELARDDRPRPPG